MKNKVGHTSSTNLIHGPFRDIGQRNSDETKIPMNLTLFDQTEKHCKVGYEILCED